MQQLGEILIAEGVLTEHQLMDAIDEQRSRGQTLGRTLVERGMISEAQLVRALAQQVGMEFVDLTSYAVDQSAVAMVPAVLCRRHNALPVARDGDLLKVAMANPSNVVAIDDFGSASRMQVVPVIATHDDVAAAIDRYCRADSELDELQDELGDVGDLASDLGGLSSSVEDNAPIVRFVNLLITQAILDRASDIHVEPGEKDLAIRYRIDGVLHEMQRAPKASAAGVVSRLKIMSDIDIAERRKPQDGRLSVNHQGRKIDLRVATLPTVWGEKVVMRILDNTTAALDLEDLGLSDSNSLRYRQSFTKPYGMILVTGPTGSGKSTTLYATLNQIARPEINVITVEDPVEYRIPGINQVQVNPKAGLTFAAALRSILRGDPDVVLVGEIRDKETAQIAIEAALTGHLVLSTLHTNDAPSAVTRLIEMDVEPFLVGSAVDCVVAQRLARRLCNSCQVDQQFPTSQLPDKIRPYVDGVETTLSVPVGCSHCSQTGYRGRLALHEIMVMDEDLERLAVARSSSAEIGRVAVTNGMETLLMDGWAKVQAGLTSLEELLRVAK
ncbi:Flp pilus assembly complex ATPase component TadA [Demequina sp. TTPB684]|uniref:GspE/PulE family protein n=1 Tax=unclassified Demequina TaxID=2620311 RepID=UPI001CF4301B|nr:ATPase, T2SS/T4P/T4SS family [Demequina sp. TMPB413]MCB2414056.1 Flp pilus assembly complex ATPase component TadA [Demequina sp. TTPB684]UPU89233.1 Flp pilus assembly complex ATPase component TadA [Demequina sp. TMPB413]